MSDVTKGCNLTEEEIKELIGAQSHKLHSDNSRENAIERIKYLNSRLKAFKEPEIKTETAAPAAEAPKTWGSGT